MKIKSVLGLSLLAVCCIAVGWIGSAIVNRGQHAMAAFMTSYSALAYLQKGDVPSAMLLLRASTEATLLEANKYGDWELWAHSPDAMSKWFAGYDSLRAKLPESTRGPVDEEFDSKLNEVLKMATAKVRAAQKGSGQ